VTINNKVSQQHTMVFFLKPNSYAPKSSLQTKTEEIRFDHNNTMHRIP